MSIEYPGRELSRRDFLKAAATSGAALAFGIAPAVSAENVASTERQEALLPNTIQVASTTGEHAVFGYEAFTDPYFNPVRAAVNRAIQDTNMTEDYDLVIPGVNSQSGSSGTGIEITPTPPTQNEPIPIFISTEQGGKLLSREAPRFVLPSGWGIYEHRLGDMLQSINAIDTDYNYNIDPERIKALYIVPFQLGMFDSLVALDRNTGQVYAHGYIGSPLEEEPSIHWQRVLQFDPETDEFVKSTDNRISHLTDEELEAQGMTDGMRFQTDSGKTVQIATDVPGLSIADINVDTFDDLSSKKNLWRDIDDFNIKILHNPTGSWEIGNKRNYRGSASINGSLAVIWEHDPTNPNEFIVHLNDNYLESYNRRHVGADGVDRSTLTIGMDKLIGASLLSVKTLDTRRSPLDMYKDEIVTKIGETEEGWNIFSYIDMTTASYIPQD